MKHSSVLRWAGSKRSVASAVAMACGPTDTFWEPFGGSLSVTLVMAKNAKRVVVGDVNTDLVNFYLVARDDMDGLIEALGRLRDDYYENRQTFNENADLTPVDRAALFYYLNNTGFNGLFRRNKAGHYNVPWGKRAYSFDPATLRAFADKLKTIEIECVSYDAFFAKHLAEMLPGDVLYADPPYQGTFSGYDARVFTEDDQKKLRDLCDLARQRGVRIVASNSDTPVVRSLWEDYAINTFDNTRLFNPNGKDRAMRAREVLITSL